MSKMPICVTLRHLLCCLFIFLKHFSKTSVKINDEIDGHAMLSYPQRPTDNVNAPKDLGPMLFTQIYFLCFVFMTYVYVNKHTNTMINSYICRILQINMCTKKLYFQICYCMCIHMYVCIS